MDIPEQNIKVVMVSANVDRNVAIEYIRKNNGDYIEAVFDLIPNIKKSNQEPSPIIQAVCRAARPHEI